MSIVLSKIGYIHNPRCGGLSIKKFFKEHFVNCQELLGDIDSHATVEDLKDQFNNIVFFTTIRHPWDWLCSRWSHAYEHNVIEEKRHHGIHREVDLLLCPKLTDTMDNLAKEFRRIVTGKQCC